MTFFKKHCVPGVILIVLLLILPANAAVDNYIRAPRKKDLRYYTMGGAYTALYGHSLMAYYNPAGYAFIKKEELSAKSTHSSDEESDAPMLFGETDNTFFGDYDTPRARRTKKKKRSAEQNQISLLQTEIASSVIEDEKIDDLKLLLDYFNIIGPKTLNMPAYVSTIISVTPVGSLLEFQDEENFNFNHFLTNHEYASNFLMLVHRVSDIYMELKTSVGIIQFTRPNFGTGLDLMNEFRYQTPVENSVMFGIPIPQVFVYNDFLFYSAFGTRLKRLPSLAFGVTVKAYNKLAVELDEDQDMIRAIGSPEVFTGLMQSSPADLILGSADLDSASSYARLGNGAGLDTGFLFTPVHNLFLGLMINDLYTGFIEFGGTYAKVPTSFDAGVSYRLSANVLELIKDPVFSFSLSDVFNRYDVPVYKRLHYGIECTTLIDMMKVRAGIHEGYLSVSGILPFDITFLRKVPFLKLFFPRRSFSPVFFPRSLSQNHLLDFYRRNLIVWAGSKIGLFLSLFRYEFEAGYYGYELGSLSRPDPGHNICISLKTKLVF